jgi:hypothetical protein
MTNQDQNSQLPPRKHPLANDANGNPIDVPPEAVAWRVRKLARRAGRPKVLFDAETGRPLEVPIGATFEDFVEMVNESGRFRLEAVDGDGRIMPLCVAVTEVALDEDDALPSLPRNTSEETMHLHQLVAHLVDANTQVMKAMASAFGSVQPQLIRNASELPAPNTPQDSTAKTIEHVNEIVANVAQTVGAFIALKANAAAKTPSTNGVA